MTRAIKIILGRLLEFFLKKKKKERKQKCGIIYASRRVFSRPVRELSYFIPDCDCKTEVRPGYHGDWLVRQRFEEFKSKYSHAIRFYTPWWKNVVLYKVTRIKRERKLTKCASCFAYTRCAPSEHTTSFRFVMRSMCETRYMCTYSSSPPYIRILTSPFVSVAMFKDRRYLRGHISSGEINQWQKVISESVDIVDTGLALKKEKKNEYNSSSTLLSHRITPERREHVVFLLQIALRLGIIIFCGLGHFEDPKLNLIRE